MAAGPRRPALQPRPHLRVIGSVVDDRDLGLSGRLPHGFEALDGLPKGVEYGYQDFQGRYAGYPHGLRRHQSSHSWGRRVCPSSRLSPLTLKCRSMVS